MAHQKVEYNIPTGPRTAENNKLTATLFKGREIGESTFVIQVPCDFILDAANIAARTIAVNLRSQNAYFTIRR